MNEAPVASFKSKRNRRVSRQTYVELNSNSFAYSFPPISPAARANVWMTAFTSVATNIRPLSCRKIAAIAKPILSLPSTNG
jgi:hypothetical protein